MIVDLSSVSRRQIQKPMMVYPSLVPFVELLLVVLEFINRWLDQNQTSFDTINFFSNELFNRSKQWDISVFSNIAQLYHLRF